VYNYNNYPPLGLISLASTLDAEGHHTRIINCALESDPERQVQAGVRDADVVGMTFTTAEVPDAYRLLTLIRSLPARPVVVGGIHPTLFPKQVWNSGLVDHVVIGEGERPLAQIAGTGSLPDISSNRQPDLERLPLPYYGIDARIESFIRSPLTDPLSVVVGKPMRWLPYESSRGCPHRCAFCINTVTGNTRYRAKSAEKVIHEIEKITGIYQLTHLKFIDDDFFVNIDRARRICAGLIRLGITWDAECRCDYFDGHRIDDRMLLLAKRSGLVQLTLGLESGSSHTLELLNKGFGPDQGEYAIRKCDEFNIIARSSFIIEVPGETLRDIQQTISFANRLRRYSSFVCGVTTFRPYPACALTEELLRSGQLTEPQSFKEWTDPGVISLYTAAEFARPWQISPQYSERAAHFLTLESATRLGDHQLSKTGQGLNKFFRALAKWRNRVGCYRWPVDKMLYEKFLAGAYRRKADSCIQS
jgi:magnesium-protoporphyrin IX monomethyl ester (oxidative) cyclase